MFITNDSVLEQFESLFLLVAFSAFGGVLLGLLHGFKIPRIGQFNGFNIKPVLKGIVIPPLILMIIMGFVARNFFTPLMNAYPESWTVYIRGFCLNILLVRGGLLVTFNGKGAIIALMSTVPQFCEATTAAILAFALFGMPWSVGFSLGYTIACISPSILVPGLMSLNERGYGRDKNIAGILIASGTFDDIILIIINGICIELATH